MTLFNLLAPNISNFQNLALFICHLFIDGNFFRTGHILHDPNVIQVDRLITGIQSVCPHFIPWLLTDVTEPALLPWKPNERTDRVLQLIFLQPDHLPKDTDDFKKFLTFYRIFVFHSTDKKQHITSVNQITTAFSMISSVSLHISENGSVRLHQIVANKEVSSFPEKYGPKLKDLFELTFDAIEKDHLMVIDHGFVGLPGNATEALKKSYEIKNGEAFSANFFLSKLNASFIKLTMSVHENSKVSSRHQIVRLKSHTFYKELSTEYEPIDSHEVEAKLKQFHQNIISFKANLISKRKIDETQVSLYPYHSVELIIIFVYGTDFKRQNYHQIFSELGMEVYILTSTFFILSAAVLCFLRRKFRLKRDGYISSYLDVSIAFTGGGNLQMRHKYERWFFGVLLIGMFFYTACWEEAVLFPSFLIQDQSIATFKELKKINPTIFISNMLMESEEVITEMLRNKMGSEFHYAGIAFVINLLQSHSKSFAVVTAKMPFVYVRTIAGERDFDVLSENLGSVNSRFQLTSDEYIPERVIRKINKVTVSFTENGFYRFYNSFAQFFGEMLAHEINPDLEHDTKALHLEQIRFILILFFIFLFNALIVFAIEIIVYHFKKWRNQRIADRHH